MQLALIVQNDFSKLQLPAKARHQGKFPIGFSLKAYLYDFILSHDTNFVPPSWLKIDLKSILSLFLDFEPWGGHKIKQRHGLKQSHIDKLSDAIRKMTKLSLESHPNLTLTLSVLGPNKAYTYVNFKS